MAKANELRIGNSERDRAADLLGEHFRAGRLDVHEYDERITAAYAAKTDSDLVPLFADLPGAATPTRPGFAAGRAARERSRRPLPPGLAALMYVALAVLAVVALVVFVFLGVPLFVIGFILWAKVGRYHRGHVHGFGPRYRSRGWA